MLMKSKIATAVTAATMGAIGAVNTAQAAYLDTEGGLGQVLILPYYNVNNNFITNINITNTTDLFKAVKLRFRESFRSQDVLDFNIYLSPRDQWTGSVRANPATGRANLVSQDETCTYPQNSIFRGGGQDLLDVYDNVDAEDVTEGYVEIIEMGVIADGPGPAIDGDLYAEDAADGIPDGLLGSGGPLPAPQSTAVVAGIEHAVDGIPPDCDVIFRAWNNDGFTKGALAGGVAFDGDAINPYALDGPGAPAGPDGFNNGLVTPPGQIGGITAYEILINGATGAAFVQEATAVNGYATVPQHYRSDDFVNYLLPSLASGNVPISSWLTLDGLGTEIFGWPLTYFDTGAMVDISPNQNVPMGANPLPMAAVLSVAGLANDFFVDPLISGSTDWVVTFPLRKHGVWNGATLSSQLDPLLAACFPGIVTVTSGFDSAVVDRWPATAPGGTTACDNFGYVDNQVDDVVVAFRYWDREEQEDIPDPGAPIVSPPVQEAPNVVILDREVNVITVAREGDSPDSVLGTPAGNVKTLTVKTGWIEGWAQITMGDPSVNVVYNYNEVDNDIANLVNPEGQNVDPAAPAPSIGLPRDFFGVPSMGFSAMEGEIGPASVGETVNHIRALDHQPPVVLP